MKVTAPNKQNQIGRRNTYYYTKKRCLLTCRSYLDFRKVDILTKCYVLEDIQMEFEAKFRIKVVEHKE